MRGTFTSTMYRLNIANIALTADDITTDMTLRFTTTTASDACSFKVFVNSTEADTLSNVPGGTATLALDKSLFVVGNNSVEVRFVSSSGTVYTDAIQLVRTQSGDYYTTDSDQSDCSFGHYEVENGVEKRQPTSLHVDVPDAIAGRDNYLVRVLVRFKGGTTAQTLALTVNGAAEPVATFAAPVSEAFQEFKVDVPATALRAGDNVLTLSNDADGEGTAYLDVDYVRIETCFRYGMTIIVK